MIATLAGFGPLGSSPARRAASPIRPFRVIRHPNYWIASLEIAMLPLVFGQVWIAVVFTALNAMLITWRVRLEDRALAYQACEPERPGCEAGQSPTIRSRGAKSRSEP
ncbi:MAG: hypothetical protein KYX67_05740 [Brevundimonas sp.]|nr:hypothetical protein [Brevundimonas sp.]MDK2746800.1 hypothetical protein [Brevundimonas sp.]